MPVVGIRADGFLCLMANTYTLLYAHLVFSTRFREPCFEVKHIVRLEAYIAGLCHNRGLDVLAMKVMPEHIHLLFRYRVNTVLDAFVKDLKTSSNEWIIEQGWFRKGFYWQRGYGLFGVDHQRVDKVAQYIENQTEHHLKESFEEEYVRWLQEEGVSEKLEYALDRR